TDARYRKAEPAKERHQRLGIAVDLGFPHDLALCVDDAHARQFQRHIDSSIVFHGCSPVLRCEGPGPNPGNPSHHPIQETATFAPSSELGPITASFCPEGGAVSARADRSPCDYQSAKCEK